MAYRERARRHHPDQVWVVAEPARATGPTDRSVAEMAAINEAYRVLGDPGRRALYDRSLAGGRTPATPDGRVEHDRDDTVVPDAYHSPLSPAGPARVPWKLMGFTAVVGSALVLFAAAFNDPPAEEPPDGILRVGSCVAIEANGDAREIACTGGDDDVVVELVLPTDANCPWPLVAHRDRLGLGTACIENG